MSNHQNLIIMLENGEPLINILEQWELPDDPIMYSIYDKLVADEIAQQVPLAAAPKIKKYPKFL